MPELPEVETTRLHIEKIFKGHRLIEVIPDPDDHIVFDRQTAEEVREALEGAKVTGTGRKGKYLWLELDRCPWPVFHLGMTGHLETRKRGKNFVKAWGDKTLYTEPKRDAMGAKFLPFCRFRAIADHGAEFAMTDPRRFGRIRLAHDPLTEPPISKLGFDPLHSFPTAKELAALLAKRRAPIKAVLLDQAVFAGVGNWIADEVLYQAGLAPKRLAAKLTAAEVARLRTKLLAIIQKSVEVSADYDRYPKSWLFHYRWGKEKEARTAKKQKIVFDTIGGRTTAWVPAVQV